MDKNMERDTQQSTISQEAPTESGVSRRSFLRKSSVAAMAAAVGSQIPFGDLLPEGMQLVGMAHAEEAMKIEGKIPEMVVLNTRPLNAEPPPHFLDEEITPYNKMFVRNNGIPPVKVDAAAWKLTIEGESAKRSVSFSIAELKKKFKEHTLQIQLECGGNGRSEYNPPAKGNQWRVGAISCAEWTGVRLRDVLEDVGLKDDAVYIGYYGADTHVSGDPKKVVISRGVPIAKAMEDESLIAWAMNGKDIPLLHGYPLRLVTGGWPASTCGKWLNRIVIRDKVHDGPKMTGMSYRVPGYPVAPGTNVPKEDMVIIESMPVKSLVTFPKTGTVASLEDTLEVRGHAWAGDYAVKSVDVSIDFGSTWQSCALTSPRNRLAWQNWSTKVKFPQAGYFEVWTRATDENGKMQPMVVPGWNPRGYLNNACHRVAVKVV
ncbi:MAG: sulfite oxidase [Desulfuromonadales bacterium]|jgi:DMSO/TMAO reductase YedYZ molybdopterin-dependent catalytic subunit|nr:sulfite oxidase [Desulfuromonadales bacterium]MDH3807801.1 sulfite oxidase [Desulfuromonadales bacterium]MDH3869469.1 sulfite oxidase [Desulfuromonadales bacterium]MDH3960512.1 sulfite oxidase [Desulfuromonadales bacterium]HKJ29907.1 sulfite oxidase [Desulfuromonadales bacterium]